MPTILIVDDSSLERQRMKYLLEDESEYTYLTADDGHDALELIRRQPPDIVLTDMLMPDMDGLGLVQAIRQDFPGLPVILATAFGNEDIVLKALNSGAAQYIPKRFLSRDLSSTFRDVLATAKIAQRQQRLLTCMTEGKNRFTLENDYELIEPLVAHLQNQFRMMNLGDENDSMQVGIALYEAFRNAMFHGNLGLESALRIEGEGKYFELARQRASQMPYKDRRLHITATSNIHGAVYVVQDEGQGFDPTAVPDPLDINNMEEHSGRGLLLIRSFMHTVSFNEQGNKIWMEFKKSDSQ